MQIQLVDSPFVDEKVQNVTTKCWSQIQHTLFLFDPTSAESKVPEQVGNTNTQRFVPSFAASIDLLI